MASPIPRSIVRFADGLLIVGLLSALGLSGMVLLKAGGIVFGLTPKVLYLAVPLVVAAGLALTLRQDAETRASIAFIGLFSVLTVYGAELYFSLFPRAPKTYGHELAAGPLQAAEDQALQKRIQKELEEYKLRGTPYAHGMVPTRALVPVNQGQQYGTMFTEGGEPFLPLGHIANRLTFYCGGFFVSDELGFPNPKGLWDQGSIDIAAVGDSVGHGDCVAQEQGVVGLIRQKYPRALNISMRGNGPLLILAGIKEFLGRVKPREVLWIHSEQTDLPYDLQKEVKAPLLMRYLDQPEFSQNLFNRREEAQDFLDRFMAAELQAATTGSIGGIGLPSRARISLFLRLAALRETLGIPFIFDPDRADRTHLDYPLFERILREADLKVRQFGGRLHFVYHPQPARYFEPRSEELALADAQYRKVRETVDRIGIPFIDLKAAFEATAEPRRYFAGPEAHPNIAGHRLMAETILRSLPH